MHRPAAKIPKPVHVSPHALKFGKEKPWVLDRYISQDVPEGVMTRQRRRLAEQRAARGRG